MDIRNYWYRSTQIVGHAVNSAINPEQARNPLSNYEVGKRSIQLVVVASAIGLLANNILDGDQPFQTPTPPQVEQLHNDAN